MAIMVTKKEVAECLTGGEFYERRVKMTHEERMAEFYELDNRLVPAITDWVPLTEEDHRTLDLLLTPTSWKK